MRKVVGVGKGEKKKVGFFFSRRNSDLLVSGVSDGRGRKEGFVSRIDVALELGVKFPQQFLVAQGGRRRRRRRKRGEEQEIT